MASESFIMRESHLKEHPVEAKEMIIDSEDCRISWLKHNIEVQ